jgi:glutathione S-transferase
VIRLYRFDYSPYVRKVQIVLDLIGSEYEAVEAKAIVPWMQKLEQWRKGK